MFIRVSLAELEKLRLLADCVHNYVNCVMGIREVSDENPHIATTVFFNEMKDVMDSYFQGS